MNGKLLSNTYLQVSMISNSIQISHKNGVIRKLSDLSQFRIIYKIRINKLGT